jgi:hypothetical protein
MIRRGAIEVGGRKDYCYKCVIRTILLNGGDDGARTRDLCRDRAAL